LLLKKYKDGLKLRNYSKETFKSYSNILNKFLEFSDNFAIREIKRYVLKSIDEKKSTSLVKQQTATLKILFKILGKSSEFNLPFYRKESKLPEVLNMKEIKSIIGFTKNPIHKLVIQLLYSGGFRVSRIINLQPKEFENS